MSISATRRAYKRQVVRSDQHQFAYEIITHMGAITAQEVAETQHIPGKQVVKVVRVKKANGTPTCWCCLRLTGELRQTAPHARHGCGIAIGG